MAVIKIFPEKDTFITNETPTANAGKDEILEVGKYGNTQEQGYISRILLKFNTEDILQVLNKIDTFNANLKMYLADAYEVPVDLSLEVHAISGSWDNGTGKFGDIPINTTGVSWTYKKAGEEDNWVIEGGDYYITPFSSQSFSVNSTYDINCDVTSIVEEVKDGNIINDGFLIKLTGSLEEPSTPLTRLKYFGSDTNTIYPPCLEIKWDDSIYQTGSLEILNTSQPKIEIINNKGKYIDEGKQRFRVAAKPKYPIRTFTTSSVYLKNYALPENSYWGLQDEYTEEMIIGFDPQFTKISCDEKGPFFDIYMNGLQPERFYRILIKTEIDGSTVIVDNNNVLKVTRNG
jgi:hypothetical protein